MGLYSFNAGIFMDHYLMLATFAAVIDDSTTSCLKLHDFHATADLLRHVSRWWKIVSVKTPRKGQMQRDPYCEPIRSPDDPNMHFLESFVHFLEAWRSMTDEKKRNGLSVPTFGAFLQTTNGLIDLTKHLLIRN